MENHFPRVIHKHMTGKGQPLHLQNCCYVAEISSSIINGGGLLYICYTTYFSGYGSNKVLRTKIQFFRVI